MIPLTLRDYQEDASNAGVAGLRHYGKPFILLLATGAGKSIVIADICHKLDEPVLILQPNKEILEQNFAKLRTYGITDIGIYSASAGFKEIRKYTYATIGSIYRKPQLFAHFKYVIIDECHQVNPKNLSGMYTKFLDAIGCNNVCGLTATPYRIDQKYYRKNGELMYSASLKMINRMKPYFFKKISYKIETADLIEMGYLSPIVYRLGEIDLSELDFTDNGRGKDFTAESLDRFWNDTRLKKLAGIIQMVDEKCQRNLVFCSSIRQATRACEMLRTMGIDARMVTGTTPMKERTATIDAYRRGEFRHMFNVGVFTTGFDVPELDCVMIARPTTSLALYYQMVGRGVRLDPARPDKVLRVYDLAGVVERLGRVETIRVQTEAGGFRDEVWTEHGRADDTFLFEWVVKKPMFKEKESIAK